jgi:anaerobic ribonucleoside-triphosphate reductase activating protein
VSRASTPISLSRLHFPVTTLGPGRRIGIWFQGCSIRCPGCISADTWAFSTTASTLGDVVTSVETWLPAADGITISGGEPFDQVEALEALLGELRSRSTADVLVFSGYSLEALDDHLSRMGGLIDAIVSDPFKRETPQTLRMRGSDNQRLTLLTPLGRRCFAACEQPRDETDRRLDIAFGDDGAIWFAGIPQRDDLARLRMLLEAQGHRVMTSEDKSCR